MNPPLMGGALSERQVAFLRVLAASAEPLHAGRVAALAGYGRSAVGGATATLDALRRRGLAAGRYTWGSTEWTVTEAGRRRAAG